MLGVLYLLLCAAFGMSFVGLAVPDVRRLFVACAPSPKAIKHIPNTLFTVPAGIVTGMMCVPFFNYYVTLGLSYIVDSGELCKSSGAHHHCEGNYIRILPVDDPHMPHPH